LKFATDGAGSSVAVLSVSDGEKEVMALKVNGKSEASTGLDVSTQLLIGHIPMLLRPQSRHALVVGLGSGMTAGAVARHSSIERLDVVEISPEVVEAAKSFVDHNDRVHENPRVHIVLDDAKSFLRTTTNRYDVVISEPSNPWMAGVAGVFTREYYESCRDRLQTNGLMLQWVQIYETDDETLNLVLRTFTSVFPFMSIWRPGLSDLALVGSTQPSERDLGALLRRFAEPAIKSDLGRIEIDRPVQLLAREVISEGNGAFMFPPEGPVHSDFFPELEFRAQKAFFVKRGASAWTRFDENYSTRPSTLLENYLKQWLLTEADLKSLARFHLTFRVPDDDLVGSILFRWRHDFPNSTLPLELSMQLGVHGSPSELEVQRHRSLQEQLMAQADKDPEPLRIYAGYLMPAYRSQRSVFFTPVTDELEAALRKLIASDPANQRVYKLYLAELAWDHGDDGLCLALGFDALSPTAGAAKAADFKIDRAAPIPVLTRMIESLWRARRFNDARELCRHALTGGYPEKDAVIAAQCRKVLAAGVQ
jgi:spermidine synthase